MTDSIAVLGAGSWGTALALLLSRNGYPVRLWGLAEEIKQLQLDHENKQFLPGYPFPENLLPEADLNRAIEGAAEILVAVPSHAFSKVLQTIEPHLADETTLSWATKGFEYTTQRLLSEVASARLGERSLAVISGPSFAGEVAKGLPTAVTVAATTDDHANRLAGYLHSETFRAYTTHDLIGVQVGGACKNILAIAAGVSDGLGFGANTRSALITRGLSEIMRLGKALGSQSETFMGLAGMGDLVLTCTDNQSRNRRMGLALAKGLSIAEAREEICQEVEGVQTTKEVYQLAQRLNVEMPITAQVYRILFEGVSPEEAVNTLLHRKQKSEH